MIENERDKKKEKKNRINPTRPSGQRAGAFESRILLRG